MVRPLIVQQPAANPNLSQTHTWVGKLRYIWTVEAIYFLNHPQLTSALLCGLEKLHLWCVRLLTIKLQLEPSPIHIPTSILYFKCMFHVICDILKYTH